MMSITIRGGNFRGAGIGILVNGDIEMSIDGLNIEASDAAFVQNKTPIDAAIFALGQLPTSSERIEAIRYLALIADKNRPVAERRGALENLLELSANVVTVIDPFLPAIQSMF